MTFTYACPKFFLKALEAFVPTERQLDDFGEWLSCAGRIADALLKSAVILIAIYFAAEVGIAFLPGGAVDRVLGGGQ